MTQTWNEHADGWDDNAAVRAYSQAAFDSLVALCETRHIPLEGSRVCDFGCGTGLLSEKLSPVCEQILAVDTSPKMLAILDAKKQRLDLPNISTTTNLTDPAFQETFDIIVCSSVCGFLDDYPATVRALVRMLKPKGLFVQWDWERDPTSEEPFGLTREQINATLTQAGLESILVETAFEVAVEGETMRPLMGAGQAPTL